MNGRDYRTDFPTLVHHLGVALRFVDIFSDLPVTIPLTVTVPAQGWRAVYRATDNTHRLVFTHRPPPSGTFAVAVEAPGGEYINYEPIQITLPIIPGIPPPPVRRSDYLITLPLWPTRIFRPPAGETAVLGCLSRARAGLDIRIYAAGQPVPAIPYTRSDGQGEFLFRLPWLRPTMSGTIINPPPNLAIEVREAGSPLTVNPATFPLIPGRAQVLTFVIS